MISLPAFVDEVIKISSKSGVVISVISGVHGNERSGPEGVAGWLETARLPPGIKVVAIPRMAPTDGKRLKNGRDLNRDFGTKSHPLVAKTRNTLDRHRPDVHIDFHEDSESTSAYVFARKGELGGLGRELAVALGVKSREWHADIGSSEDSFTSRGIPAMTVEVPPSWSMERRTRFIRKTMDLLVSLVDQRR